ncbi:MAG: hypothetical protein WA101_00255 [Minisyncoccia bacterium]
MENSDQIENKVAFRKMLWVIGGIVLLAGIATAILLFRNGSKETFNPQVLNTNTSALQTSLSEKPLFSEDVTTWANYYWPGKINTHYPNNWLLKEEITENGLVVGIKMIPATGNAEDTIFIGGSLIKCSDILKYSKNQCLKNKIQIPFYTNSTNQEVLNAFDLIFQNTVLTEIEK